VGLTLLLVVVLAYLPGILGGAFHFDDVHHITKNDALRDPQNLFRLRYYVDAALWSGEPGNMMYRPTGMIPHAVDFLVWDTLVGEGLYPSGWLMTNALLHALVAVLIWRLALRLGLSDAAAALAGLVAALHPVHSEVVNYVSSRSESLAAALVLLGLLAHLRSRNAAGAARWRWVVAAAVLSALAVTAKETAALFFLAVAWMELTLSKGPWKRRLGRAALAGGVYLVVFLGVLWVRKLALAQALPGVRLVTPAEGADVQVGGGRTVLQNLLTQSRVVLLYFQLLLRPVGLNVDHDVAVSTSAGPAVVVSVLIHLTAAAAAFRSLFRGGRLFPLCAGWFWIFLAPSVVVPLNVIMNEHRLYLPGIAVALLAGAALARVGARLAQERGRTFAVAAVAAPFVLFLPVIVQRSQEWRDDFTLWSKAVERSPDSARAHMHLGAAWHERANAARPGGRLDLLDRALEEYVIADRLHGRWFDLQLNLGGAYLARGRETGDTADFERALAAYELAGEIVGPKKPRTRFLRAVVLTELERYDEAIALLRALDEEDDSVTTLYDDAIARAYRKKGDTRAAIEAMDRVIALEEPQNTIDGLLTAGWWFFEDGELQRSQGYLTRALHIAREVGERDLREARRKRLFRAHLYVSRFLTLVGTPDPSFVRGAKTLGWTAPEDEVAWVAGGRTPGAAVDLR
jgi:tetratricopeptide (TPR) repeat protein